MIRHDDLVLDWTCVDQVPRSQPYFSLNPDPDQKKEDTSFLSFVAYGVCIPLSFPIKFRPLPNRNFEENAKGPARIPEPWIQDPQGYFAYFRGVQIISSKKTPVI